MTNIILSLIKMVKGFGTFLLPDALFNQDIFTNFSLYLDTFTDIVCKVNFLVPLPTLFQCLSIIVALRICKLVIYVQNWLVKAVLDVIP